MSPRNTVLANFGTMLAGEGGASLVEYALIIALVSIVALAALRSLGNRGQLAEQRRQPVELRRERRPATCLGRPRVTGITGRRTAKTLTHKRAVFAA